MLRLPNNCRAGKFNLRPKNWDKSNARVNTIWKISYWFYDDNLRQRELIVIKGMNRLKSLKEKQEFMRDAIAAEKELIKEGWNHITQSFPFTVEAELDNTTPVLKALEYAKGKLRAEPGTLACVKSCLGRVKEIMKTLHMDRLAVKDIRRRHLKLVLEKCGEKKGWSTSSHNHYRAYLSMLFKELVEMDVIDTNPVRDLAKKKETRRMRPQLTKEERARVRKHLRAVDPDFWTYVHIFFHSSGREVELLRVKASHVDLAMQRFRVLVKKGSEPREEWATIKDIIVEDWKKLMDLAGPDDYLFSKGLLPGPSPISRDRVTRRWEERVKKDLGIDKDLYSLKHSNLDEMADALQKHKDAILKVSKEARHTTPVVTMNHYLAGEPEREKLTVQKIHNEF